MRTHRNQREYALDFAKVIATTLILLLHYHQNFAGMYTFVQYYGGKFYFGHIVELFFMLSGLFAVRLVEKGESFPRFIGKRLGRLWPVMILAAISDQLLLIVYKAMTGELFSGRDLSLWGTIISALGIQNDGVFFNQSVNNPTWYISVLLLCYVFAYFWNWLSRRTKVPVAYFYAVMIVVGASTLTRNWNAPLLNNATGRGYVAFFTGACLSLLCDRYGLHQKKPVLFVGLCLSALFWLLFALKYQAIEKDQQFLCVFVVWPSLILLLRSPAIARVLNHPWLGTLGDLSFDTYVWHANVVKCFYLAAQVRGNMDALYSRGMMIAFCAASWLVGALSYYCLDRPISKRVKRIFNRTARVEAKDAQTES